jgi:hypothetical protein
MAVPGLTAGWFDDGPLTPADIDWGNLRRTFDDSEQAVFEAAFAPGAGARPQRRAPVNRALADNPVEAMIAASVWED